MNGDEVLNFIRIDVTTLQKEISGMNARMDSFVDQITSFKTLIYSQMQKNVDAVVNEVKQYDRHFKQVESLNSHLDGLMNKINELEKQDKRAIADVATHSERWTQLKQELTHHINKENSFHERLGKLEAYFKEYNFSIICSELENLDKEYQKKVSEVISRLSKDRESKIDLDFFFEDISALELTVRTTNCLRAEGIIYVGDLLCNEHLKPTNSKFEYSQLMRTPNLGKKSYKEIMEVVTKKGFKAPIKCEAYWSKREAVTNEEWDGNINNNNWRYK